MGGNISLLPGVRRRAARARARSDKIDKQIEEERRRFKRECKVLLMGTDPSETSTIVKGMKIIHRNGFSLEELSEFRPVVYRNVMESAHQVLIYMTEAGLNCENYSNRALADKILDFRLTTLRDAHPYLPSEIAEAIHDLWNDPVITEIIVEHSSRFDLTDTARYFLSEVIRIGQPGYVPNEMDVLRAHQTSVGVSETKLMMGQLSVHLIDVGAGNRRAERRKWIHLFESVTSVIFCTLLSDYDRVLREDRTQNRMAESLILWESVINSRWFLRTSFILFMTRIDVFKNKLPRVPLERYFPEYTGGTDINKAAKYILWKYMQANRARLSVYPHLVLSTDTTNIRLVFAAVKETILHNALKDREIL
ncbi:heterotrimeric G-protein alpha subunit, GPA3-like protein [Coprinopsis sp. MPI-PUGE-AT-0042]|nr:heterotrimeric G-protein alpha subunit, GPA3-like protein [Coprinopsis sp. MPI-PUGE-AT-0042]